MNIKHVLALMLLIWMPSLAAAEITVERAWMSMPPSAADTAAIYLVLKNSSDADVRISSVQSDAAGAAVFHGIIFLEGTVLMQKIASVIVPAHGELKFSPGGNHVMLKDLKRELKADDVIILKLTTADGQPVEVHALVRDTRTVRKKRGNHQ